MGSKRIHSKDVRAMHPIWNGKELLYEVIVLLPADECRSLWPTSTRQKLSSRVKSIRSLTRSIVSLTRGIKDR
jgi:hypothetical protein